MKPKALSKRKLRKASSKLAEPVEMKGGFDEPGIDRTAKLFVGGKQARPDGAYSRPIHGADGE